MAAPEGHDVLVTASISTRGPVAIWSTTEAEAELHARHDQPVGGATFPVTRPASTVGAAVVLYDESGNVERVASVRKLPVAYPMVDVLADGSFLVVGARCEWSPEGPEQNALAIDQTGQIVRRGCLGDGIQHLQVGADGTIWAGYFDEGVFGNIGWGVPGPTPLGAGGIAAWSPSFEKVWELDPEEGLIADCYSLNVSDGVVWSCPYTDFPVVRIEGQSPPTVHPTRDVSGPSGIVASGDSVALIGTYRDPTLLIQGMLRNGGFTEARRTHLRMPNGRPLAARLIACRGPVAYFVAGRELFSFDLAEVASS